MKGVGVSANIWLGINKRRIRVTLTSSGWHGRQLQGWELCHVFTFYRNGCRNIYNLFHFVWPIQFQNVSISSTTGSDPHFFFDVRMHFTDREIMSEQQEICMDQQWVLLINPYPHTAGGMEAVPDPTGHSESFSSSVLAQWSCVFLAGCPAWTRGHDSCKALCTLLHIGNAEKPLILAISQKTDSSKGCSL